MNSIILCEGSTDFILLQYYMRKMYAWEDDKSKTGNWGKKIRRFRTFSKGESFLSIGGCGGCSRIIPAFDYLLERNSISAGHENFDNIVIITDRDEVGTENEFTQDIKDTLKKYQISNIDEVCNNKWVSCQYYNGQGRKCEVRILLLVIPFEETGAMETFLLNAIAASDEYDAKIIGKCNEFVDKIDIEKRYLTKRRYITKSKFDVYFSVRTAAEQFVERQNLLLNVPWEKYTKIQENFEKLGDLG